MSGIRHTRIRPEQATGFGVQGSGGKNVHRSTLNAQRSSFFGVRRSTIDHQPSTTNHAPPTPKFSSSRIRAEGFTLFELLAVITIIGIVLAVTLGSFTGWGDASAVSGGAKVVEAVLNQAHDYAVARRVPVSFKYQTAVTNALKKTTTFQLVQEASIESATNLNATASDSAAQLLGSPSRLPGGAWILRRWQASPTEDDAEDRIVFLPNGRVVNPADGHTLQLLVVSRKTRSSDGLPCVVYHLAIDPVCGAVTTTKLDVDAVGSSLQQ